MAINWPSKAPLEVVERQWAVPVADDDSLASYIVAVSGVTLDSQETSGDEITLTLSGGTDGANATVDITATTTNGLVIDENFYLPIREGLHKLGNTVRDVCDFALRPVLGLGQSATAAELDNAQEVLDDMLAEWSSEGANLEVRLPTQSTDVLSVNDSDLSAIKHNLRMRLMDTYGQQVSQQTLMAARRGVQSIKMRALPDEREGVEFF